MVLYGSLTWPIQHVNLIYIYIYIFMTSQPNLCEMYLIWRVQLLYNLELHYFVCRFGKKRLPNKM